MGQKESTGNMMLMQIMLIERPLGMWHRYKWQFLLEVPRWSVKEWLRIRRSMEGKPPLRGTLDLIKANTVDPMSKEEGEARCIIVIKHNQ